MHYDWLYDIVFFTWTFMGGWMHWFSLRRADGRHSVHTQTCICTHTAPQPCYDDIQSTISTQRNLWLTQHPFSHKGQHLRVCMCVCLWQIAESYLPVVGGEHQGSISTGVHCRRNQLIFMIHPHSRTLQNTHKSSRTQISTIPDYISQLLVRAIEQ